MNSISIILSNLYNSQLGYYVTKELNKLKKVKPLLDCIVFTENPAPITLTPQFGIMNIAEAYDQTGMIIATSPASLRRLQNCWSAEQKVFYSWDLFWLRGQYRMYEPYLDMYRCNIDIIARSEEHKKIIENNFNIKVKGIVENFNMDQLLKLYEEKPCPILI